MTQLNIGLNMTGKNGPLYDPYARRWFTKLANKAEIQTKGKDLKTFKIKKNGNLGIELSLLAKSETEFLVILSMDKHKYRKWAIEHLYLMESMLTFRLGPVIFAHPGREVGGKINIWEAEQGFQEEFNTSFFNLCSQTVMIRIKKNEKEQWTIERIK